MKPFTTLGKDKNPFCVYECSTLDQVLCKCGTNNEEKKFYVQLNGSAILFFWFVEWNSNIFQVMW